MSGLPLVQGSYKTRQDQRSLVGRISPALAFYPRIFSIIFWAGARAKRGRYDDTAWQASSLAVVRTLEKAGVRFDVSGLEHVAAVFSFGFSADSAELIEIKVSEHMIVNTLRKVFAV